MDQKQQPEISGAGRLAKSAVRLLLVLVFVWALVAIVDFATHALTAAGKAPDPATMQAAFWGMALLYSVVLAIPFVPGVEIGLSMMMIRGAEAALPVYAATILGLTLAYSLGRYVPYSALVRWTSDLGLRRASVWLESVGSRPREERLEIMRMRLPRFCRWLLVDYRYVALAILLNLPGNALIGGGGGILLIAGLSRLFDIRMIILTVIIAVAPVPLAFLFFGPS